MRAPEHPSAVSGNSLLQQGERGSGQAGEKLLEKLFVCCSVCPVPIKRGIVDDPLWGLTKAPWRKFVNVETILTVKIMKCPSKVKYEG